MSIVRQNRQGPVKRLCLHLSVVPVSGCNGRGCCVELTETTRSLEIRVSINPIGLPSLFLFTIIACLLALFYEQSVLSAKRALIDCPLLMRLNYAAPHREVVIAGRERLSAGAIVAAEGYGPEAVENGEDRKEGRNGARAPEAWRSEIRTGRASSLYIDRARQARKTSLSLPPCIHPERAQNTARSTARSPALTE
jgi:hypothetical protein